MTILIALAQEYPRARSGRAGIMWMTTAAERFITYGNTA
jgi:hypothetical protein